MSKEIDLVTAVLNSWPIDGKLCTSEADEIVGFVAQVTNPTIRNRTYHQMQCLELQEEEGPSNALVFKRIEPDMSICQKCRFECSCTKVIPNGK